LLNAKVAGNYSEPAGMPAAEWTPLAKIIFKLLQCDPRARYQSAAEVVSELLASRAKRERRKTQCVEPERRWRSSLPDVEPRPPSKFIEVIGGLFKKIAELELGTGPLRLIGRIVIILGLLISTAFFSYAAFSAPPSPLFSRFALKKGAKSKVAVVE
jgi:hypothetical protein